MLGKNGHTRESTCLRAREPIRSHARTRTDRNMQFLIAFARQQWFRERASAFCYTCIACIVEI